MVEVLIRYRRFPLFSSWSGLLNTASVQIPVLILSSFFGASVAGLYSLSTRVLQIPIVLVGQAVTQVFFSRAAGAEREGVLPKVTLRLFRILVHLALPGALFLCVSAPALFSLVFGSKWRMAGVYSQWLSPWLFLVTVAGPLSCLPSVLQHQRGEFLFQSTLLSGRIIALLGTKRLDSPLITIAVYGVASALLWLGYLCWILRISGNRCSKALANVGKKVILYTLFFGPSITVRYYHLSDGYMVSVALSNLIIVMMVSVLTIRNTQYSNY